MTDNFDQYNQSFRIDSSINEIFFEKIGSKLTLDSLYLYLVGPSCLIGLFLNAISYLIFLFGKDDMKMNLFKYLKAFTLNSMVLCLLGILCIFPRTPRYFEFSNNFLSRIIRCKIISFVGYTLVLYSNLLSIVIILERVSLYSSKIKKIMHKLSTNGIIFITLFLSILINIPIYFHHTIRSDDEFNDAKVNLNKTLTFTYCDESQFYKTLFGKILLAILAIFRDFLILLFELIVSIISIRQLKIYVSKKQEIILGPIGSVHHSNTNNNILKENQRVKNKLIALNKNITEMTISLTIFSIVCNVISFVYVVLFVTFENKFFVYYLIVTHYFIIGLRHGSNIIFYYYYNKNFRSQFIKLFKLKH